ncbi:Bug family tripartite tricarboxylate transporter substrate binding protein [Hydrogenophaga sp.]|uniref:Bug family tripartite tricarboxylate transporter substrate binding protein n=1 Tax=Hydrogenophaga sp. TaxID=1904254 RepID=UPI002FC6FF2A
MVNFTMHRRQALMALAATPVALSCSAAWAQTAGQTVRFVLPVSAGSGVDAIARAAGNALGQALGQTVVIENLPGAGGVIGTQTLVRSAPDGLTLSLVSNNHVIYPSVIKSLPFDPVGDITPITIIGSSPLVLVVSPHVPARDLREFAALLKANPGQYNFASAGNGTILHLAAELFKDVTGTFSTHIPYRGTGPMVTDIMSGQVDWGVVALPAIRGQIEAGRVRALCVATPNRVAAAPQIPTAVEQGFDNYVVEGWVAAVGPKGLSVDQVKRLHAAFVTAFSTPEVKEAMAKQGNVITLSTPEAALGHFKSEMVKYAGLVKKAGVVPQ